MLPLSQAQKLRHAQYKNQYTYCKHLYCQSQIQQINSQDLQLPVLAVSVQPASSIHKLLQRQVVVHAKKKDIIDMDGEVVKNLPGNYFSIQLDNGFVVRGYLSGRMRQRRLRLVVGDKVQVELSTYDLTKGRILQRYLSEAEIARQEAAEAAAEKKDKKKKKK